MTQRMKKNLVIVVFSLLCNTQTNSHSKCKSLDFVNSFQRRYCPTGGGITANILWHQCKLSCLQTPKCNAVNYNFSSNYCTHVTTPCTKAIGHPEMAYVLFTGRQPQQCIEWIPKTNSLPLSGRLMSEDNRRYIIRMQKNGNDYIGHLLVGYDVCISRDDRREFKSSSGSHPCQYLRISEDCSVMYVDYVLGTLLPPNALIGGHTAEGFPLYIGREDGDAVTGYYIPGTNRLITARGIATGNVKLLVSL